MNQESFAKWFDRPIAFHRIFVDLTGSVPAALMLSQAIYWGKRTKSDVGWFYKSSAEWFEETGLTRHEQDSARKQLKKHSFWQEKLAGVPATCHFRVDNSALFSSLTEIDKQVSDNDQFAGIRQASQPESGKHSTTENTIDYIEESNDSSVPIAEAILGENTGLFDNIKTVEETKVKAGEKKKAATKKKEKDVDLAFKECVRIWLKEIHPDWVGFNASEGKALKELLKKMRAFSLKKNEVEISTEDLCNFFTHYCKSLPEFYKSHELKVISSKFDSIIEQIKTGRDKNTDFRNKPSSIFSQY